MRLFAIVLMALIIAGCAANPGYISMNQSKFDDAIEMSMNPGWCASGNIRMGLFWSSRMPKGELILKAGVNGIKSISTTDSLKINIDGEKFFLSPFGPSEFERIPGASTGYTYIPGSSYTYQGYKVNRAFIEKMMSAQKVIVRLDLLHEYIEDDFSTDAFTMAKPAFREFITKLEELNK